MESNSRILQREGERGFRFFDVVARDFYTLKS